jgi:hypothetical protein
VENSLAENADRHHHEDRAEEGAGIGVQIAHILTKSRFRMAAPGEAWANSRGN